MLTNNVIRPEDITLYLGFTREFKIVGRMAPIETTIWRVRAYEQSTFSGNFVALSNEALGRSIFVCNERLDGLMRKKANCSMLCSECGYCQSLYERCSRPDIGCE